MAVHTKHPVSAPPAAPVREKTGHLLLRAWCILIVFTALASAAWNNLLGPVGFGILIAAQAVVSVVVWVLPARERSGAARLNWRRLPWFPLAYLLWAGASLIWTTWPLTTLVTWSILAVTTLQGLFIASVLTWHELVRAIASALKWIVGLSLLIELWVAAVLRHPLLPDFVAVPEGRVPPELYWVRGNLFDGGRIQGIVGNSNLLGFVALLAIVVFAIRFAARAPRRGVLVAWIVLAAFLFGRAASVTSYLAAAGAALVLATVLVMRTADRPGDRTRWYALYAVVGVGGAALAWVFRDALLAVLGRSDTLTGRDAIWSAVLEKASQRPVAGWGFATPWLPWDPHFDGWIVDHGLTVFMAHSMWVDALFQLGWIGVAILGVMYLAFVWRAWFFAVDRPRWDLDAHRPYSPLSLLPTLVATVLLVQGIAESRPLMEWGWLFVVMLSFKIKQSPHVGAGPAEQSFAIEQDLPAVRGSRAKRVR